MENPGIDPGASRMQSERSSIWANSPEKSSERYRFNSYSFCEVKVF